MSKPSLLILSLGELGTSMLEAAARSDLFDTIIVGSRNLDKARERVGNATIGAGLEGHFPEIRAEAMDFTHPDFGRKLTNLAPDYLFSAPSLFPWWRVDEDKVDLPFAGFTALHLALMAQLRGSLSEASHKPFWIGASYPDVINAVLNRTGFGPDCGIGNVQEPIPKIQRYVAQKIGCPPDQVKIQLVAQHAFEYYVLNATSFDDIPPHLLNATYNGKDVSGLAAESLSQSFPFPYDLHFNRVTASAGVQAMRSLTSHTPTRMHLPGIGNLVGGYPVLASCDGIEIDLPEEWTIEHAKKINEDSLRWDGIESVDSDGTIHFTPETSTALKGILGHRCETLTVSTAHAQAQSLLSAL